jgi:transcriptional regulator with XRE-family HTH domain
MYNFDGGEEMSTIGDNIKKYRELRDLTQEYIAKAVGKSKNVVSNWECGKNKPDADIITILCGLLGVDANTLMGWDNTEQFKSDTKNVSGQILYNPKFKEILSDIAEMSNKDIDLVKDIIKRMK